MIFQIDPWVGAVSGRCALRPELVVVVAAMLWFSPAPAQGPPLPDDAGLSDLSLWQGPTFGTETVRADFSAGIEEGLKSFGDGLAKIFTPQVGDRLALTPPFREHVGAYSVTVGYRVTEISLAASARVPGAVITVTGRRPDGAPLKTGTSIDGVDLDLGGKRLRADTLRSFVDLSVGENEIAVEVANGGAGTKRTYRATVVRLDADLENADERSQLFREALLKGSADGLSRAIAAGADPGAIFDSGKQRASPIIVATARGFEAAVEVLVRAGADVNDVLHGPGTSAHGASALFTAVEARNERIVRLLLKAGADPDLALPGPEINKNNRLAGATPLLLAVYRGHDAVAHQLIEAGADVNRMLPDSIAGSDAALSGSSPLMLAAYQGKEDLVRLLIDAGADVSYRVSEDPARSGATNPVPPD